MMYLSMPFMRLRFMLAGVKWRKGWRLYGFPILQKHRLSHMSFGAHLQLRSSVRSNPAGTNHPVMLCTLEAGSSLTVGDYFGMSGGSLMAKKSIRIGDRVTVGANTIITDSDFHPMTPSERRVTPNQGENAAVVIEDDVFIGMNCLILKGVTIGRGCLIGAGSVVTKSIPAGAIAAGNPARVIRSSRSCTA